MDQLNHCNEEPSTDASTSSTSLQSHAHSRAKKLTKEQRLEVRTLAREGYSYQKKARRLQVTYHQARYVANADHLSPKKSSGRSLVLSSEQVDEIEAFVILSPEYRQLTYFRLVYAYFSHFGVSEKVIQQAMSGGDTPVVLPLRNHLFLQKTRERDLSSLQNILTGIKKIG
ncbi:hypothetical protein K3495_g14953 [Podosphaera aphanis]|nr:hypothetical protein K3495_g14953 [Podosphaera aphanis]